MFPSMTIWFAIPSKRPTAAAQRCINLWRGRGYLVAIWRDTGDDPVDCDLLLQGPYPGYAKTVNLLAKTIIEQDPHAAWIVAGGDDTMPDQRPPEQIAAECTLHFSGTFGVMQPTGDPWSDSAGRIIDRIAGSPWLGRDWCLRANQGQGPMWPDFDHMFVDDHVQELATLLGVFWQRRDVTHFHAHAQRDGGPPPPHMARWNTRDHWIRSLNILNRLRASEFLECLPL